MPKITIKYEHPHELTDLLGKLMRMYVAIDPTCDSEPYKEITISEAKTLAPNKDKLTGDSIGNRATENHGGLTEENARKLNGMFSANQSLTQENHKSDPFKNGEVNFSTKDNSPFIADSDNQSFTLEEAAEYLEVDKLRALNLMFDWALKSNAFKIKLSELRKIKNDI